ncbi:MAG: type II secretion system F family protein [Candidatus Omnitrophota bacterium]
MATYKYKAKKGPGKIINAQISAASREEAVERISQMGYMPVRIELAEGTEGLAPANLGFLAERVGAKQITVFTRQLAVLLKSGVPILKGLKILSDQATNRYFQIVLGRIHNEVKDGKTLSSTLAVFPKIFPALYIALVKAGEESGTLEKALLRIAEYRQKQERIFSQIRTALTYPILMGIVGIGTIIFMLTFVMPRLLKIFTRLGQDLPLPTKIIIAFSNFLNNPWVWLIALLIISFSIFLLNRKSLSSRELLLLGSFKLKMPIFGQMFLKAELACFSITLELLLASGIQLLKAIQTSIPTLNNEVIKQELVKGYKAIEQGESFGLVLDQSNVFPKFMVNLIKVGEESGNLDEALHELANTYEQETEEAIKIMTNLLEPIMILIMGAVVGFIIVSMLLPVFQLNIMVK